MADYLPLISRAVNGLDKNTGEIRRALYERARAALVDQLRSVEPALDESDITRERLALEDAIRKVEADAVRRMRPDAAAAPPPAPDQGLRGLRDTVADAEGLGDAAAAANRSAHELYDAMPGEHGQPRGRALLRAAVRGLSRCTTRRSWTARARLRQAEALSHRRRVMNRTTKSTGARCARMAASSGSFVLLLVLAGLAGGAYWQRHAVMSMVASFRSAPAPKPQAATPATKPKIPDRVGAAGGTTGARQRAGRRGRAKGRAVRRGPERPEGQAFRRLGALAHRDGVAGTGARARTRDPRRRGNSRAAHAHDLVAAPQHRQGAAGEPHHRDHVHAAGGFSRRRHRQCAGRADEAGRAGARRAARRASR